MSLSWQILLVAALPTLGLLGWSVHLFRRARRSVGWPRLPATIVESQVRRQGNTRSPKIAFEFEVQGDRVRGRRLWVGPASMSASGDWADRVVARFPVGAQVQVAADPADPGFAVLEPGVKTLHWLLLAGAAFLLAGTVVAVVAVP